MKKFYSLCMILCLLFVTGCDVKEKLYYSSGAIPHIQRQMKSPGFWISRQPLADKVILDPAEITAFNANIEKELDLTEDLPGLGGVYSGEHGTGKRKRGDFLACNGPRGVEDIRRTKAALDPEFLLNRGNVVTVPPV